MLVPLGALVLRALHLSWAEFWRLATTERALAAYRLSFTASSLCGADQCRVRGSAGVGAGRYEFPGRRVIDAIVDFPFALPTAVAGLTLASLFAGNGWLGR